MSGRLIITTKKTYCPWNQQNVERVLRDERLERERIEREAQLEKDAAKVRRRELGGAAAAAAADGALKHVNLFPEAEEAELRLARGLYAKTTEKKGENGIMPVPLGGAEAANRKAGSVPFYMQHGKSGRDNASYNEMRVLGRKVEADVITGKIMNEQALSREESRKTKMDPMMRFYVSGECQVVGSANSELSRDSITQSVPISREAYYTFKAIKTNDYPSAKRRRKAKREHHHCKDSKRRRRKQSTTSDSNSAVSSGSSISSSSLSHRRRSTKSHKRKHKRSHERRSKKRSKRDRDRKHPQADAKEEHPLLVTSQHDHNNTTTQSKEETIENLRKRRQAREARESEREKNVLGFTEQSNAGSGNDRERGYLDQWNPKLSRK